MAKYDFGDLTIMLSLGLISNHPGINLSNLVPELDTTASDIISNQRDSLVQRKELAQKTKDFRRLDDNVKLVEFKALLKG